MKKYLLLFPIIAGLSFSCTKENSSVDQNQLESVEKVSVSHLQFVDEEDLRSHYSLAKEQMERDQRELKNLASILKTGEVELGNEMMNLKAEKYNKAAYEYFKSRKKQGVLENFTSAWDIYNMAQYSTSQEERQKLVNEYPEILSINELGIVQSNISSLEVMVLVNPKGEYLQGSEVSSVFNSSSRSYISQANISDVYHNASNTFGFLVMEMLETNVVDKKMRVTFKTHVLSNNTWVLYPTSHLNFVSHVDHGSGVVKTYSSSSFNKHTTSYSYSGLALSFLLNSTNYGFTLNGITKSGAMSGTTSSIKYILI